MFGHLVFFWLRRCTSASLSVSLKQRMMIEKPGSFCQLWEFAVLLLPSVSGRYERVFTTYANYMAPRIADNVFLESLSFLNRFLI
jgi:hypothetical protein